MVLEDLTNEKGLQRVCYTTNCFRDPVTRKMFLECLSHAKRFYRNSVKQVLPPQNLEHLEIRLALFKNPKRICSMNPPKVWGGGLLLLNFGKEFVTQKK